MDDTAEWLREIGDTVNAVKAGRQISYAALVQYRQWYDRQVEQGRQPPVTLAQARALALNPDNQS